MDPNTFKRLLSNEKIVGILLTKIRNQLGRQLTRLEGIATRNHLNSVDASLFPKDVDSFLTVLSQQIVEKIIKNPCGREQVDIHEMLKSEIGVSTEDVGPDTSGSSMNFTQQVTGSFSNAVDVASVFGSKSFNDFKAVLNPDAVKKTAYIFLDSRYRVLDNDGRASIRWNFTNNASTIQGSVNYLGDIQNIVSMRIAPFKLPYTVQADNEYKKITMYIQEFSAQSIVAHENRKFHFICDLEANDRFIDVKAKRDESDLYVFKNPISRLDTITISFGSPLQPIVLDLDRRNMKTVSYDTVITFETTDTHNLETGDMVYISGFSTANPDYDINLISKVNNVDGISVTYINDSRISIAVDCSSIKFVGPGTVAAVKGSNIVNGTGTSFFSTFILNDVISINGSKYTVSSIQSDTKLTISTLFVDTTISGATYEKDNTLVGMNPSFYFGSKRIMIPMSFEYLDTSKV